MKALRPVAMVAAFATLLCSGAYACLDFTPITSFPVEGDAGASVVVDAGGGDGPRPVQQNACLACAAGADGGGCPKEYAACMANGACAAAAVCATGTCLASLATVAQCLSACEDEAGVSDPKAPGNAPFSALLSCASTHCELACLQ
jgi:hypothetical protein